MSLIPYQVIHSTSTITRPHPRLHISRKINPPLIYFHIYNSRFTFRKHVAHRAGYLHPERLQQAIRNSHHVVTAWSGERLVGLMNALSDGTMTAYFHYLLVDPTFQSRGIGRELVARMTSHYRDCTRLVLVAYKEEVTFYERCGFRVAERALPVQITSLDD